MRITETQLRKLVHEVLEENLWDNIRKKRARGEKPAKKGDKDYPDEKSWKSATKESDEKDLDEADGLDEIDCWDGYSPGAQTGVKTKKGKGGKRVNNCEKIKETDEGEMNEAFYYHLEAGVGVDQNIFRPGSTAFFSLFREARRRYLEGLYLPTFEEMELLEDLDIGEFAMYEGQLVPLDYPIMEGNEEHLNEAEYKGKKVDLNKPIRGGDKGAYVYVNSGKKDKDGKIKVKKVSFGSSMPDAMGDSDAHKKRRKNYGDRHNCADKDDMTKAGYWSCRATKFFGRDIAGWW